MSFFNKNKNDNPKLEGRESIVSSNELISEVQEVQSEEDITTDLSIHPDWNLAKEDQYAYQFLNMECPPLKPNQLSLSGISLMKENDLHYRVTAFVRNSLDKEIQLEDVTLVLLNEKEELLGRKAFNLQEIGNIPARSSRPWHFMFSVKDLFTKDLPHEGWKLAFMLEPSSRKHSLDLAASWKQSLASQDKKKLQELVDSIEPPKHGEVNFMGLQAKFLDNGDFHVTMLIRNGSEKDLNLEQIPLHVQDAAGDIVVKGGFTLEDFSVKANTSKPWTFIFPASLVEKKDPDLSRWKAFAPQN